MDKVTIYGVGALTFMMLMYAFERRDARFILAFAVGCALSSAYGFLSGAWPFGVVEIISGLDGIRPSDMARGMEPAQSHGLASSESSTTSPSRSRPHEASASGTAPSTRSSPG